MFEMPFRSFVVICNPYVNRFIMAGHIQRSHINKFNCFTEKVGDAEKLVRALFEVANHHQPAVIFIDEIDSLLSKRNSKDNESANTRKTEFLAQMVQIISNYFPIFPMLNRNFTNVTHSQTSGL